MCLAVPVEIIRLLENKRAIANIGGIEKEISLALVEEVAVGDFVILHVGYALTRLDTSEAQKTLSLLAQLAAGEQ